MYRLAAAILVSAITVVRVATSDAVNVQAEAFKRYDVLPEEPGDLYGYAIKAKDGVWDEADGDCKAGVCEVGETIENGRQDAKTDEDGLSREHSAPTRDNQANEALLSSVVVPVDRSNWNAVVNGSGSPVFVVFYFASSGAYEEIKEDFEDAAKVLEGEAVFSSVNATEHVDFCKDFDVQWSPTFKLFVDGAFVVDYKGPRNSKAFRSFLSQARDLGASHIRSLKELKTFQKTTAEVARVYAYNLSRKRLRRFEKIAVEMRSQYLDTCAFAVLEEFELIREAAMFADLPDAQNIEDNGLFFVHSPQMDGLDGAVTIYNSDGSQGMGDFISMNILPLIGPMGKNTAIMYKQMNLPVVVAFHEKESVLFGAMQELFTSLAKKMRSSMLFTYGDPFENSPAVEAMFPQKGHDEPRVVILWLASEHPPQTFKHRARKEDTRGWLAELETWIKEYYERLAAEKEPEKTPAPVRSEAVPLSQSGPYVKVVAKTWTAVVEDPRKDVLIIIHTPDTEDGVPGPSDLLLRQIAKVKPFVEHVHNLVFAEMNGRLNLVPKEHRTPFFPIMRLFPAGASPKTPVFYTETDGTVRTVLKWLSERAKNKFHVDWSAIPYEDPRKVPVPMNLVPADNLGEKDEKSARAAQTTDNEVSGEKSAAEVAPDLNDESEFFSD
eukprot:Plantae.Rhodophyta-Purpureofilum_apyrenoidigerum.ctg6061.p1 GENE.Plantae.Rhodophyta-Purpureofilum_apyrenoidigerum.ctg6061~~Plantae.Rhodophyta-Purpureofilum_apyrenoidigerum.ctg6061.p1  ORF type:complete len:664 (-),score=152.04 Plantae.Rhodophyta-Purpureofilum_apyrenoidigerum.ctg6061:459-2450(-)